MGRSFGGRCNGRHCGVCPRTCQADRRVCCRSKCLSIFSLFAIQCGCCGTSNRTKCTNLTRSWSVQLILFALTHFLFFLQHVLLIWTISTIFSNPISRRHTRWWMGSSPKPAIFVPSTCAIRALLKSARKYSMFIIFFTSGCFIFFVKSGLSTSLSSWDYTLFHAPYNKLVQKSYARLVQIAFFLSSAPEERGFHCFSDVQRFSLFTKCR